MQKKNKRVHAERAEQKRLNAAAQRIHESVARDKAQKCQHGKQYESHSENFFRKRTRFFPVFRAYSFTQDYVPPYIDLYSV